MSTTLPKNLHMRAFAMIAADIPVSGPSSLPITSSFVHPDHRAVFEALVDLMHWSGSTDAWTEENGERCVTREAWRVVTNIAVPPPVRRGCYCPAHVEDTQRLAGLVASFKNG